MRLLLLLALALAAVLIAGPANAQPVDRFHLVGPITRDIAPYVLEFLKESNNPEIVIDSPGGSMDASSEIADAVKAKGNVRCVVKRAAASGAFAIFQACAVRVMGPRAKLGTHEPMMIVPFPINRVAAAWFLAEAEKAAEEWNARCRARLKLTAAEYEQRVRGKDWILSATEALEVGAVDRIAP